MKTTVAIAASMVMAWLPATVATAAIKNWNTLSGNWNTAGNWAPAGVPGAGDDVNIKPSDGVSRTITYDYSGAPITLNSLGVNLNGGAGASTTTLSMASNTLTVGELDVGWSGFGGSGGNGTFTQTGGTTTVNGPGVYIGVNATDVGTYNLSGSAALSVTTTLVVGSSGAGTLNIQGNATAFTNSLSINSTSFINLNGGTLRFNTVDGTGGLSRINYAAGTIQLAGDRFFGPSIFGPPVATNTLFGTSATVPGGKALVVEGGLIIGTADGPTSLTISGGGIVNSLGGRIQGSNGFSSAAFVTGLGSVWNMPSGSFEVGHAQAQNVGILNVQDQALVSIGADLIMNPGGIVNIDGGTLRFNSLVGPTDKIHFNSGTIQLAGNRTIGSDAAISAILGAAPTLPSGKGLTVEGAATISTGLTLNGGSFRASGLTVNGSFHFGGGLLELTGGSITGLTNLNVPSGGEFRASGIQSLRVTGAAGSTITATGNLTLGNASAVNGFGTQGTLVVGANAVTLLDANDVVFDSLASVSLGSGATPGALNAANGLTLDFGGNITGVGAISTPNNVAKPLINNGHIAGNSAAQRITLPGYVKGVGTFDNVNITGTFSPGLSPTSISVGNLAFSPTSTLVMELGGTTAGSQYDQIDAAGELTLDGTLQISLINGFTPAAGQTFDLFNAGALAGSFSSVVLPNVPGLTWDATQLASGMLTVVPTFPGDFNGDGSVTGADLNNWKAGFGTATGATRAQGDANGDGDADGADFLVWQRQLGSGAVVPATDAVPEPATMASLSLGLLLACRTAKRRRLVGAGKPVSAMRAARRVAQFATIGVVCAAGGSSAHGLNVTVDYSFDLLSQGGSGFFESTPTAVAAMNAAAADISAAIGPSLAGIPTDIFTGMSGAGSATINCTMTMRNPCTGIATSMDVFTPIAADAFTVFAGMRAQSPSTAFAEVATGSFTRTLSGPSADQVAAFNVAKDAANATIRREGGGGVGPVNNSQPTFVGDPPFPSLTFGPLAASVSFDNDADNNNVPDDPATRDAFWHYEHDQPVAAGQIDFYTVSLHEILHSVGFGIRQFGSGGTTWNQMRSGTTWNGSRVIALNGGSGVNMVSFSEDHIGDPDGGLNGYISTRITDGAPQEVVMDFNTDPGARKFLTHMDLAFMEDIGYALAPTFSAADFNEDGFVDGDDLAAWTTGFGTASGAMHSQGDANGDGAVDAGDFLVWQRQLGIGPPAEAASAAVPEPATIVSGLVALAGYRMRKRPLHSRTAAAAY